MRVISEKNNIFTNIVFERIDKNISFFDLPCNLYLLIAYNFRFQDKRMVFLLLYTSSLYLQNRI